MVEVPSYAKPVLYDCKSCGIEVEGHAVDAQEAPTLFCPECDAEMNCLF